MFLLAYRRGVGAGWGGTLTSCKARYRKDVVKWMMLLCTRCGYLEDVVALIVLLRRRWCYFGNAAVWKMLL